MPGRRDSSVARSSIADIATSWRQRSREWKLEGQIQPTGQLAHLLLGHGLRLRLRVGDGDRDEVFEHFDVSRIHHARVELELSQLTGACDFGDDHPPA